MTTNPEYTNTQQDLPDTGILSPLSRHVKLFGYGVYFAQKATNNGSLLPNFSLGLVYTVPTRFACISKAHMVEQRNPLVISQSNHFRSILITISLLRCDEVTKVLLTERDGESIRFNLARWT